MYNCSITNISQSKGLCGGYNLMSICNQDTHSHLSTGRSYLQHFAKHSLTTQRACVQWRGRGHYLLIIQMVEKQHLKPRLSFLQNVKCSKLQPNCPAREATKVLGGAGEERRTVFHLLSMSSFWLNMSHSCLSVLIYLSEVQG